MNIFRHLQYAWRHFLLTLREGFAKKSDKIMTMGLRNQIALGIMVFGVGIIVYAVIIPFYVQYQNDKMVELAREAMEAISSMEASDLVLDEEGNVVSNGNLTEEEIAQLTPEEQAKLRAQLKKEQTIMATLGDQKIIGILNIEALHLEYAIVEGTNNNNIRVAVGHIETTAPIGGDGNCVIAGHRGGQYGEFFKNIHKLQAGDLVTVTGLDGKEYTYSVYEQVVVKPKDWSVTEMVVGQKTLTLLSCENSGTRRLAVKCRMVEITKDESGKEIITVVKSTATPPPTPTPEPTPSPTPTPIPVSPILDVKIVNNHFDEVVYTGKTDEEGNWNTSLPNGTYTVTLTNELGVEVQVDELVVGDGVTNPTYDIVVMNSRGETVYVGKTDADGNYNVPTDNWESGVYTFKFTNVFGTEFTQEHTITQ